MSNGLSTAQVLVNNDVIAYVPNSLEVEDGFGEFKVRTAVIGKGKTENIFTENAESKKGSVKFSMITTADNVEKVRAWKNNQENNVVEVVADGFQRTFTNAVLINKVPTKIGADGTIELEWESDPAS